MNWLFRIGIILSILSILVSYSRKHPPSSQVMLDPVLVAQIILANTTSRAGTVDKAPSVHIDPDVRGPFLFDFSPGGGLRTTGTDAAQGDQQRETRNGNSGRVALWKAHSIRVGFIVLFLVATQREVLTRLSIASSC